MRWQDGLARAYPILAGAIFLGFGAITLIRPEVLEYYSISVDNSTSRIAARAMIGGGEIGLGLVLLFGGKLGFSNEQRSFLAATIFISVALARLVGLLVEGELNSIAQPIREASIELLLGLLGAWAGRSKRTPD